MVFFLLTVDSSCRKRDLSGIFLFHLAHVKYRTEKKSSPDPLKATTADSVHTRVVQAVPSELLEEPTVLDASGFGGTMTNHDLPCKERP